MNSEHTSLEPHLKLTAIMIWIHIRYLLACDYSASYKYLEQ